MTLVFPAPLGPSRPSTSPRATVKETSSTAVWRPYRLRSPEHQTAGDGVSPASVGTLTVVAEVIPWTVAASAETTGDRQQFVGTQRAGDAGHYAVLDPDHAGEEPVAGGEHGRLAPFTSAVEVVTSSAGRAGAACRRRGQVAELVGEPAGTPGSDSR